MDKIDNSVWVDKWPEHITKKKRKHLTNIIKIKGDWREVANDCRFTVGKDPIDHEPSTKFKKNILISEHSPIRDISFKWIWKSMPHWITVHWVRHKWEKFVRTQRTDRTGSDIPRNEHKQGEPQDFEGDANVQALIDTMRKRLCYQASKETREYAEDLKCTIHDIQPEVADVLVPNCIYRCGCPELCGKHCERYENMMKTDPDVGSHDIQKRYDAFNKIFYGDYQLDTVVNKPENESPNFVKENPDCDQIVFDSKNNEITVAYLLSRLRCVATPDHLYDCITTSDGMQFAYDDYAGALAHEQEIVETEREDAKHDQR